MKSEKKESNKVLPKVEEQGHHKPHRTEDLGRPIGLPHLKMTEILEQEPENTAKGNVDNAVDLIPHRPETVGRPVGLPTLKLTKLLEQEPQNSDSEEIDTGTPVGKEVC